MNTTHRLKCWPEFFVALEQGRKRFEIRLDDRGFKEGDTCILLEYDPVTGHTGRSMHVEVTYHPP